MATPGTGRWGITFPFEGISLADHREVLQRAERAGFTDAWTAEVNGADAFTPIAAVAGWTQGLRFGTAIANIYTRTPTLLAMNAAAVAEAAPDRFCLGLGTSSPAIVERWNGVSLQQPLQRMRDTVAFLRSAFAGEKVSTSAQSFNIQGLRLARPPGAPVPIFVAALRKKMLALAGESADGVIINWLSPDDASKVVRIARDAAVGAGRDPDALEVACRIFVIPTPDENVARMIGRFAIAGYLTTPLYHAFHQWLGRGETLRPMMEAWQAGERRQAAALVPEQVVDEIFVYGNRQQCLDKIESYRRNGVTVPILAIIPTSQEPPEQAKQQLAALDGLAPP